MNGSTKTGLVEQNVQTLWILLWFELRLSKVIQVCSMEHEKFTVHVFNSA